MKEKSNVHSRQDNHDEPRLYPQLEDILWEAFIESVEKTAKAPYRAMKRAGKYIIRKYSSLNEVLIYHLTKGTVYDIEDRRD